jgi:hypothetical protein
VNHGTLTAYCSHACRCPDCKRVANRHVKAWRLRRLQGEVMLVDAQPMRDHVQALLAAGMSFRGIALTAGWKSRNSLASSLERDRVTVRTFERVMAISPESDMRRFGYVDATGSQRRLQGLVAIGWTTWEITRRMGGKDHGTVTDITSCNNTTIRRATADAIKAIFDELWDKPGPSRISAQRAAKRGWVVPLAWDDDTIDDPAATPDLGEPDAPVRRGRSRADVVEDYLDTWDHHLGYVPAAAARLGMTESTLMRLLYRARADGANITFTGIAS